jgi:hypothetical protein
MYQKTSITRTSIKLNESSEGETIEQKLRRIVYNREPITDSSPTIYTERSEGVRPELDIRTDKFDQVIDALDSATDAYKTRRDLKKKSLGEKAKEGMDKEAGSQSIQATDNK